MAIDALTDAVNNALNSLAGTPGSRWLTANRQGLIAGAIESAIRDLRVYAVDIPGARVSLDGATHGPVHVDLDYFGHAVRVEFDDGAEIDWREVRGMEGR